VTEGSATGSAFGGPFTDAELKRDPSTRAYGPAIYRCLWKIDLILSALRSSAVEGSGSESAGLRPESRQGWNGKAERTCISGFPKIAGLKHWRRKQPDDVGT
jgi:hypothetical protein